jgi:SAM-dependent methyltransferase
LNPRWDPNVPSAARLYNYLLGGCQNFAVDRQLAEQLATILPGSKDIARMNRAFMRRAVLFMISAGIRQFLDIGSGIPAVGNVHELAQQADSEARVVYVDIDPIAVAHNTMLLESNDRAVAIQANLTEPDSILGHCDTRRLLDFTQPMGLLLVGVLHFVSDEWDLNRVVARYRTVLAPGSYVAMAQLSAEARPNELATLLDFAKDYPTTAYPRTHEQFIRFFEGFELVEPGMVSQPMWRPESNADLADLPQRDQVLVGVARKPYQ